MYWFLFSTVKSFGCSHQPSSGRRRDLPDHGWCRQPKDV